MNQKRILITPAGEVQKIAIEQAKEIGLYVIAADENSSAAGMQLADKSITGNICDTTFLVAVAKEYNVDGILSICCDANMVAVSEACAQLGLAGISPSSAIVSSNKIEQRKLLSKAGLAIPRFAEIDDVDTAYQFWRECGENPVVVKPIDGSGSRGVRFVEYMNQIEECFHIAREASKNKRVIMEQYIEGVEYSVEGWALQDNIKILTTSRKLRSDPPYLLDTEVRFPSGLSQAQNNKMINVAQSAISACGYKDCPVHLECILSDEGPIVVELAARGAGFKVFTEILPRITGINTVRCSIETALGKPPNINNPKSLLCACLLFIPPVEGLLTKISGLNEAKSVNSIHEIEIHKQIGDVLGLLKSGSDRAGHVLAFNVDAVKCISSAKKALSMIKLEVKEIR